jgi:hypothetical protein
MKRIGPNPIAFFNSIKNNNNYIMEATLQTLTIQLAHAKNLENSAKASRIQAEEAIIALMTDLKEKGSKTIDAGNGLSVTITTGLTYKVDFVALERALPDLVESLAICKETYSLNNKLYENLNGEDRAKASACVTVTPKKISVTLKVK